jgi:hypothetical protein
VRLLSIFIASACLLGDDAHAQLRSIPAEAKQGELRQGVIVTADSVQRALPPGAQIRDPSNRIVVPTAVPAGTRVKYMLDAQGQVRQVWILTSEEAAKEPAPKPAAKTQ